MNNSLTTSTSLTLQKKSAVMHALNGFMKKEHRNACDLLKRLQCTIDEEITGLEFSREEIYDIIDALKFVLKEIQGSRVERYGFLSIADLQELLKDFEKLSQRF